MVSKSIIFVLIISIQIFPQNNIKVLSSNRNQITIEYTPSYSDTSVIEISNQKYIKIGLKDGYIPHPEKWGMPSVPERSINIGVPSETGNTLQVISSSYKTLEGKLAPKPKMIKDKILYSYKYEIGKDYYQYKPKSKLVAFGIHGMMRRIPVQVIKITPIEYNPSEGSIKLYTKIIFRVNFSQNQSESSSPAGGFLKDAIINYKVARYWAKSVSKNKLKKTATSSVLATGIWYRFETPKEGIYEITRSMLPKFGIDANTVDPRTIKIYNNGGKALPEGVNDPHPEDLKQNAILVVGEDDGKFDSGDYILFYARGTDFREYDTTQKAMVRSNDPYSNVNYYWITSGGSPGKRMQQEQSLSIQNPYVQTSTKAFLQHDEDKINIGQSGQEYYGYNFKSTASSMTYENKLNNRVNNYPVDYKIRFINASPGSVGLVIDENGEPIINKLLPGYGEGNNLNGVAYIFTTDYYNPLPDNNSILKFNFTPSSNGTEGYLDYFEISYQTQLEAVNDNLLFYSKDTTAVIQYNLSGFSSSNIKVFNVTDYANVKLVTNYNLLSGGECGFQASERAGHVSKYAAIGSDKYLKPTNPIQELNSNLLGEQQGAQLLIITNKLFNDVAERLKTYKETQAPEKYSTIVTDIGPIYNEFSCGMVDPTAMRNYIKYAFDNWKIKPEYVLFLGKGTYDAKDVLGDNQDFVPAYETKNSLDQINSYTTDDYFVRVNGDDLIIDMAYGRIPVTTDAQASYAVDKIIYYENSSAKGTWRNLITLVADDDWTDTKNEGDYHTVYSETLANNIIPGFYNIKKIYLGEYPVVITGEGRRYPQVNQDIVRAMNEGTLIINYFGHGNQYLWAHEQVFNDATSIPQLHNTKFFLLVAGTCEFDWWDTPDYQCGSEELVLLKNAGAIATISSSRLVYAPNNEALVDSLFKKLLLSKKDSANLPITIGKALFLTKQSLYGVNSQKYELLGDPTIRLIVPRYSADIDSINGKNLTSGPVQIKALSKVCISGEIIKPDNSLWNDFNGTGMLTVYDSKREKIVPAINDSLQISQQGGVIFNGDISVKTGKFTAGFTVPKDISYENKNGKIQLYFYNDNTDGLGYTTNILVGGTDTVVNNGIGPKISIFFDDTTYKTISLINSNSTLIVKLFDINGLNTTGTGIGHKLEGILNAEVNNPIDFTNYFTGDLNSGGKSGEINYKFNNLAPGNYTLKVSAWDVFNNYSSKTVDFTVVSGDNLVVRNVYNYPDPFTSSTTFTFQQNLNEPLNVKIKVYTIAGRLISEIERGGISEKFVKINWNGRDQDGDLIANGTYLFKLIVSTVNGKYTKSVLGKMAVIR